MKAMCFTILIIFATDLRAQAITPLDVTGMSLFLTTVLFTVVTLLLTAYLLRKWVIVSEPRQWLVFYVVSIGLTLIARELRIGFIDNIPLVHALVYAVGTALMAYGLYCMKIISIAGSLYKRIVSLFKK